MEEYNAAAGARRFEHAAGPNAGQRNFQACVAHYQSLWKPAVRSRIIPTSAATKGSAGTASRHSVDAARSAVIMARADALAATDTPQETETAAAAASRSLEALVAAGMDIRRDTTTTSNFDMVSPEDLELMRS